MMFFANKAFPAWHVDASQILSRGELSRVLATLAARAPRLANVRMNLAIVRLACCCGLRATETAGLRLADVRVGAGVPRPHLYIRTRPPSCTAPAASPDMGLTTASPVTLHPIRGRKLSNDWGPPQASTTSAGHSPR